MRNSFAGRWHAIGHYSSLQKALSRHGAYVWDASTTKGPRPMMQPFKNFERVSTSVDMVTPETITSSFILILRETRTARCGNRSYVIGAAIAPAIAVSTILYRRRVPTIDSAFIFAMPWMISEIVIDLMAPEPPSPLPQLLHQLVEANYVFDLLQGGVPEPPTCAIMILAFCGLGFVTYRRRNQALPQA